MRDPWFIEEPIQISADMLDIWDQVRPKTQVSLDIETGFGYFNVFSIGFILVFILVFWMQKLSDLPASSASAMLSGISHQFSVRPGSEDYVGIFTAMFLHGSLEHLIGNVFLFYLLSLVMQRIVGTWKSAMLFVVTGIFAGICSYHFNSLPSLGASGAIFGMFGFVAVFYIRNKNQLTENLHDLSWVMLISALLQIASWFVVPYIDNSAHLGGFIAGCLLSYVYFYNTNEKQDWLNS